MPTNNSAFFDYAELHGLALLPIPYGFKEDPGWKPENRKANPTLQPIVWRWSKECSKSRASWEAWYALHHCNFGIAAAASGCIALDLDVSKDADVWAKFCKFWTDRGINPPAPQFKSARAGWHVLVKVPTDVNADLIGQPDLMPNVNVRASGYIVAPGSFYDGTPKGEASGHYQIVSDAAPPHVRPDVFAVVQDICGTKGHPKNGATKSKLGITDSFSGHVDLSLLPPLDEVVARLQHAYDVGPVSMDTATSKWARNPVAHADNPDEEDRKRREANGYFANYTEWSPVVGAIKTLYAEAGRSRAGPLMDRGRDHKKMFASAWASKAPPADVAYASLKRFISASNSLGFDDEGRYAKAKGDLVFQRLASVVPGAMPSTLPVGAVPMIGPGARQAEPAPPEYGEIEIADRFVNDYSKRLSFVTARNCWLVWDGKRWRPDETGEATDLVRKHCRSESALYASTPGTTAAQAKGLCSSKTVGAVVQLARIDQRVASRASDWDQDEWLLGTPDGVVELKTGTLRAARPEDCVTKSTAVSPSGDCPTWLTFLNRATNGDAELQGYLQRLAGYYLTGSTAEQSLQFVFGPGRSGKGTFMHAISAILADYHVTTAIETLTESKSDRHPTEIAALQGARLVTCSETERGRHWAESRIKQFTGGDEISARYMNQNFFTFVPTFKLLISGNYKPHLRPDTAMRRRFQLLPFMVTIPEREEDKSLGAKLKREWPGILGWMIAGALAWQGEGLNPPAVVLDATREYMDEEAEDVLSTWLADCCDQSDARTESRHSDLYRSYKNYCEQAGERPATSAQLGKELKRLGFEPKRTGSARLVVGLRFRLPPVPSSAPVPLPETYRPQP